MATNLPSWFSPEVSGKLYFVEQVKPQRSYDFLITKELIFWLPNFGFFYRFSASLKAGFTVIKTRLSSFDKTPVQGV